MRIILYRAKRKDNGGWVRGLPFSVHATTKVEGIETWDGERHLIIPETLGECTGIKDVNDILVYEGDVVRVADSIKLVFGLTDGIVAWSRGMFHIGNVGRILLSSFDAVASYDGILRGEIIGNIHDNPELKEKYA